MLDKTDRFHGSNNSFFLPMMPKEERGLSLPMVSELKGLKPVMTRAELDAFCRAHGLDPDGADRDAITRLYDFLDGADGVKGDSYADLAATPIEEFRRLSPGCGFLDWKVSGIWSAGGRCEKLLELADWQLIRSAIIYYRERLKALLVTPDPDHPKTFIGIDSDDENRVWLLGDLPDEVVQSVGRGEVIGVAIDGIENQPHARIEPRWGAPKEAYWNKDVRATFLLNDGERVSAKIAGAMRDRERSSFNVLGFTEAVTGVLAGVIGLIAKFRGKGASAAAAGAKSAVSRDAPAPPRVAASYTIPIEVEAALAGASEARLDPPRPALRGGHELALGRPAPVEVVEVPGWKTTPRRNAGKPMDVAAQAPWTPQALGAGHIRRQSDSSPAQARLLPCEPLPPPEKPAQAPICEPRGSAVVSSMAAEGSGRRQKFSYEDIMAVLERNSGDHIAAARELGIPTSVVRYRIAHPRTTRGRTKGYIGKRRFSDEDLQTALARNGGSHSAAARDLGVSRQAVNLRADSPGKGKGKGGSPIGVRRGPREGSATHSRMDWRLERRGEEIRRLRAERGWSQSDLARRVGTCHGTIGSLELGVFWSSRAIAKIEEVFGLERGALDELIDRDAPPRAK